MVKDDEVDSSPVSFFDAGGWVKFLMVAGISTFAPSPNLQARHAGQGLDQVLGEEHQVPP